MKKWRAVSAIAVLFLYLVSLFLLLAVFSSSYKISVIVLLMGSIISYVLFLLIGTMSLFTDKKPLMSRGRFTAFSVLLVLPIVYVLVLAVLIGGA